MAWKFLNIGKANARIDELEKSLTDAHAATATAQAETKLAQDALASNESEIVKNAEKLSADLSAANAELVAAKSSIANLSDELNATKVSVGAQASARAQEITAAQGQPPLAVLPQTSAGASECDVVEQLNAIKDPRKRVEFYRANKAAIDNSFK